jgi:hypothetical protein
LIALRVILGDFLSYAEERGVTDLLVPLDGLLTEAAIRFGMMPVKTDDGATLLVSEKLDVAVETAFGFTQAFEALLPEPVYLPTHVAVLPGGDVALHDGHTVELAAYVTLSSHPGEIQPVLRG